MMLLGQMARPQTGRVNPRVSQRMASTTPATWSQSRCSCSACNPLVSSSLAKSSFVSPAFCYSAGRFFHGSSSSNNNNNNSNERNSSVRALRGVNNNINNSNPIGSSNDRRILSGRYYHGSSKKNNDRNNGSFELSASAFNHSEASMSLEAITALGKRSPSTGQTGSIPGLFDQNRAWSERIRAKEPDFFDALSKQQNPKYLWIGCSDSRVPANEVVGLRPGELFVHRNVANVVVHTDLNCLSVIQYAVEALRVEHIIVCGHYGCGGVNAALNRNRLGLIDNWLRHIVDIKEKYRWHIEATPFPEQLDTLCELNVIEQTYNVCETTVVQDAWMRGQKLQVHSWIYGLSDGLLKDLGLHVSSTRETEYVYEKVIKNYT